MNNFFTLKDSFKYFIKDLIGAGVIFILGLVIGAPIYFFGTLSGLSFFLILLIIWLRKSSLTSLELKLFPLARMAVLLSLNAELFVLGFSIYNGVLFNSFRLILILSLALIWAAISYKLLVRFSLDLDKHSSVDLKIYKTPIFISIGTLVGLLILGWTR